MFLRLFTAAAILASSACSKPQPKAEAPQTAAPAAPPAAQASAPRLSPSTLLLSQAQFAWETDADGKRHPAPGPAKLVFLTPQGSSFGVEVLEDPESRVFHKAACVQTEAGVELLTAGGTTDAYLKLWRFAEGKWQSQVLWHPRFGGKFNRVRDFEIADIDGVPGPEILIATHDQGVVAVATRKQGNWTINEIYREPDTFIHEVEVGDVDRDGRPEIYVTPSKPNKADVSQGGGILAFRYEEERFVRQEVAHFENTHAKEILVADIDGDKQDELYAAVEAVRGKNGAETTPVEIRQYIKKKDGWASQLIASLENARQARVLLAADLTQSGRKELVVSTMHAGIWRLRPGKDRAAPWDKALVMEEGSGFEHAANAADLDGDGRLELYDACDDQDVVRELRFDGTQFVSKTIYGLDKSDITWNIMPCKPQAL